MKIALIGLGHLGKIHFKCLKETGFDLVGISDPKYIDSYESIPVFDKLEDLLPLVDACIIAAPTTEHFSIASKILSSGKHCFLEKPMAASLGEAEKLAELAISHPQLITQVGFVERYNPAYLFLENDIKDPKFIEVHRLAQFNERGNDVSVVFDLMIHDLDLLLSMKSSPIKEIKATGVKVFTSALDICNARIEFMDGAVANITASRMSMKVMRKFRIFQNDCYLSMDLGKKESQVVQISDEQTENSMAIKLGVNDKHMVLKSSGILAGNAIVAEQTDFYNSIVNNRQSKANFSKALITSKLASDIEAIALNQLNNQ